MKEIMADKDRLESRVHRRYLNAMTEEEYEEFASDRPAGRKKFDDWYSQLSEKEIENYIRTMPDLEPPPPIWTLELDA